MSERFIEGRIAGQAPNEEWRVYTVGGWLFVGYYVNGSPRLNNRIRVDLRTGAEVGRAMIRAVAVALRENTDERG